MWGAREASEKVVRDCEREKEAREEKEAEANREYEMLHATAQQWRVQSGHAEARAQRAAAQRSSARGATWRPPSAQSGAREVAMDWAVGR